MFCWLVVPGESDAEGDSSSSESDGIAVELSESSGSEASAQSSDDEDAAVAVAPPARKPRGKHLAAAAPAAAEAGSAEAAAEPDSSAQRPAKRRKAAAAAAAASGPAAGAAAKLVAGASAASPAAEQLEASADDAGLDADDESGSSSDDDEQPLTVAIARRRQGGKGARSASPEASGKYAGGRDAASGQPKQAAAKQAQTASGSDIGSSGKAARVIERNSEISGDWEVSCNSCCNQANTSPAAFDTTAKYTQWCASLKWCSTWSGKPLYDCAVQVNCVCGATDDDGKPMVECDICRCCLICVCVLCCQPCAAAVVSCLCSLSCCHCIRFADCDKASVQSLVTCFLQRLAAHALRGASPRCCAHDIHLHLLRRQPR